MIEIEFNRKLFTNNEMKRWYNAPRGKGWAIYAAWKNQLKNLMRKNVKEGVWTSNEGKKWRVDIVYTTKKKQDKDNFYASLKPLLDAMVELGLLVDDSPEWIDLKAEQVSDYSKAYLVNVRVS